MANTLDAVVDILDIWFPDAPDHAPAPAAAAGAILDLLGIAYDKDEASTLIESDSGTYGLAYEPSTLSDTAGPRVKFLTSPDPHHNVTAYVRMDGQVEVRTEGLGYSIEVRPMASNAVSAGVRVDR